MWLLVDVAAGGELTTEAVTVDSVAQSGKLQ